MYTHTAVTTVTGKHLCFDMEYHLMNIIDHLYWYARGILIQLVCSMCVGVHPLCGCCSIWWFAEVICLKWFHGNQVDVTGDICCLKLSWEQGECTLCCWKWLVGGGLGWGILLFLKCVTTKFLCICHNPMCLNLSCWLQTLASQAPIKGSSYSCVCICMLWDHRLLPVTTCRVTLPNPICLL